MEAPDKKDRKGQVEWGMYQGEEADPALGWTAAVLNNRYTIGREGGSKVGEPNSP